MIGMDYPKDFLGHRWPHEHRRLDPPENVFFGLPTAQVFNRFGMF